jgi:hypothetical protein
MSRGPARPPIIALFENVTLSHYKRFLTEAFHGQHFANVFIGNLYSLFDRNVPIKLSCFPYFDRVTKKDRFVKVKTEEMGK